MTRQHNLLALPNLSPAAQCQWHGVSCNLLLTDVGRFGSCYLTERQRQCLDNSDVILRGLGYKHKFKLSSPVQI